MNNDRYVVNGPCKLNGEVRISGAKNSILPIMCAAMLTNEKVELTNVPNINDVKVLKLLLEDLGASIELVENKMKIINLNIKLTKDIVEEKFSSKIRYSVLMLGLILAKNKGIEMNLPGGCKLGKRPIDIHLSSLKKLGVDFTEESGKIYGITDGLKGANINLRFPTVSGTENIIIASATAEGITVINNASREPEVEDLCHFLNSMGANIQGIGTRTLIIQGVEKLHGTQYSIIPDRIETATFMAAAAITGGEVLIKNTKIEYLFEILKTLQEVGCKIEVLDNSSFIIKGGTKIEAYNCSTRVYPGLPTDVQPVILPVLAIAEGVSQVEETIYKERFAIAKELNKMGADIRFEGINSVIINGVHLLKGTEVRGDDLRAGVGLVIAGLAAEGETIIYNAYQINRGYESFEYKIKSLGANIRYEKE